MPRRGLDEATLIAAAAEIADAEGVAAVTVARVASALGIRGPSVYSHVAGREALVNGIALRAIAELTAHMRDAAVGRSGEDAVRAVARAYRSYARDHPGLYAAIQRAPRDARAAEAAREAVAVLTGMLAFWRLAEDDAVHAVRALRSALHGFVDLERTGAFAMDLSLDESFERLVSGLIAGLAGQRRA